MQYDSMQSRTIRSASAKHRSPLSMTSPPALYMVRAINGPHHHQPHGCRNHAVALPPMQNPDAGLAPAGLVIRSSAFAGRPHRLVLRDIGARNERLPADALQHNHPNRWIPLERAEKPRKRVPHAQRHRIASGWLVESHPAEIGSSISANMFSVGCEMFMIHIPLCQAPAVESVRRAQDRSPSTPLGRSHAHRSAAC